MSPMVERQVVGQLKLKLVIAGKYRETLSEQGRGEFRVRVFVSTDVHRAGDSGEQVHLPETWIQIRAQVSEVIGDAIVEWRRSAADLVDGPQPVVVRDEPDLRRPEYFEEIRTREERRLVRS